MNRHRSQSLRGLARLGTVVFIVLVLSTNLYRAKGAEPAARPNIVVVMCDDLGAGELGCCGSSVAKTPHLDAFATQGLLLTQCYAGHPNCSSARAALMTGRIPFRTGIHNWIPQGSPMHLRSREITVAKLLKQAGYATCLSGKWHLSGGFDLKDQPTPGDHGFDHWFATQNVAVPTHRDPENFYRNGQPVGKLEGYAAQLVVAEAIDWLGRPRQPGQPFFLFVAFHEPHERIATDPRFVAQYEHLKDPIAAEFWGNISQLDDAFGRLMRRLDELELSENTLVWFTSDNGSAITTAHPHGSTGGLRGKKSQVYEGGVRVPGLLRWPSRIARGQASAEPVSGIDLLPTVCDLAKIAIPQDRAIDGTSLMPVFSGKSLSRKTPLYWQFHRADSPHKVACRIGDWKMLATLSGPQLGSSGDILQDDLDSLNEAGLVRFELYNLRDDRTESNDLFMKETERGAAMSSTMRNLFREVLAESPRWPIWHRFPPKPKSRP